jgi:magnesium transporter
LDVLSPTETEMKVLCRAFGIHQLTSEDILMDEPREKVELFPSYYFVNYRTFEQDKDSDDYMEPINMYVIVFRDGVISFHHSMSPHPANVRRRIRQLNDYMSPTADWISYAIIDDVTDVYAPLVTEIEQEVDYVDEEILYMHTTAADAAERKANNAQAQTNKVSADNKSLSEGDMGPAKIEGDKIGGPSGGDMLRRVGECRKKVMGLYRLLGNKADVIKGFAKRCNEHWEVAPRSEIGLYLGDIQDHIVTMTGNLSHYER